MKMYIFSSSNILVFKILMSGKINNKIILEMKKRGHGGKLINKLVVYHQ